VRLGGVIGISPGNRGRDTHVASIKCTFETQIMCLEAQLSLLITINYEEIPSCFVLNVFYSYVALSNGSNWEFICLIPIFGAIFGQNLCV
jgi:hypothetical protein